MRNSLRVQATRLMKALWPGLVLIVPALWLAGCSRAAAPAGPTTLHLTSSAFADSAVLPAKYTCDGAGISPPLAWSRVPHGTKSLAIICQDPDAPSGTFTHWLLYGLPADLQSMPEGVVPLGARQGTNDFGRVGYGAPCPPSGTHQYIFTIYALDIKPNVPIGAMKSAVFSALRGHVLAQGRLIGVYRRASR